MKFPCSPILFAVLMCFCVPLHSLAQRDMSDVDSDGLVIETDVGWDGAVDTRAPVPIAFLLNNFSEEPIEGELVLSHPWGQMPEKSLGEVFISPNSTRQLTTIQNLQDWNECVGTIRKGDKTVWRRHLNLNTGQDFSDGKNYILFFDAEDRQFALPKSKTGSYMTSDVAPQGGRRLDCFEVPGWQVPKHCGPMAIAQTVVLSDTIEPKSLNRLQVQALANWVCQGGHLFANQKTDDVLAKILAAAPLGASEPAMQGSFEVRTVGLGQVYSCDTPFLSTAGKALRGEVAEISSMLPKQHPGSLLKTSNHQRRNFQSNRSYILMFGLFTIYAILSGVVTLVLFRLSRKQIATYVFCVVGITSVAAALLGGLLRMSQGDLNWSTVTVAGPNGAVQFAKLQLKSAGSRNIRIAVEGSQPDLQYGGTRSYRYWNDGYVPCEPFSWTPNNDKEDTTGYATTIPMTPFGQRVAQAVDYVTDHPRIDFKLEFDGDNLGETTADYMEKNGVTNPPSHLRIAKFRVKIQNNLGVELRNCHLVVNATSYSEGEQYQQQQNGYYNRNSPPPQGLTDVQFHQHLAGSIAPEGQVNSVVMGEFKHRTNHWERELHTGSGSVRMPRLSQLGDANAWFVCEIKKSPSLSIDRGRTDFFPQSGYHLYMQRIEPEDMPDLSLFYKQAKQDSKQAKQDR